MKNKLSDAVIGLLLGTLLIAGCGQTVNYDRAKQQAGENAKEYLLYVSGMT